MAVLLCTLGASLRASAADYEIVSRTLLTEFESCPNGVIDPGETNTIRFVLKKLSDGTHNDVRVQIIAKNPAEADGVDTDNVAFPVGNPGGGVNVSKDGTLTADVSFRSSGVCGDFVTPTILITRLDGSNRINVERHTLSGTDGKGRFRMGADVSNTRNFASTSAITINDFDAAADKSGRANPYGSTIKVEGVPHQTGLTGERVSRVAVTLNGLTHQFSQDLNVLLVSPSGQKISLMKQAGSGNIDGATLTFSSSAATALPAASQITSGTYRPSDYNAAERLPDHAQAGNYSTDLNDLNVTQGNTEASPVQKNPNGDWKLFVQDDTLGGNGTIAGGWSLAITTTKIECCGVGQTFPVITTGSGTNLISGIPAQEMNEDQENKVVAFSISDLETSAGNLTITATSSDQALVANSEIVLEGNQADRTVKIKKPVSNAHGTTVITVTVADASGRSTSTSFNLKINPLNDAPVISTILGQSSNKGVSTAEIPFTVTDVETDASLLVLTATSSNTAGVPNANIFIRGTGANRTVQVVPSSNGSIETEITIRAVDPNNAEDTETFKVSFTTETGDPTFTPHTDKAIEEDKSITLPLVLRSNSSSPVANLTIDRASGNTTLLPVANIAVSGTGADRSVTLTPAANQHGTALVTLILRDPGNGRSSTNAFQLTVTPINDKPVISAIADQTINEDAATGNIAFTVTDVEGSAITVSASSSNDSVVPSTIVDNDDTPGIRLGGSGENRTIRIKPTANAFGRATITVSANDGTVTETRIFNVTVNPVNDAPQMTTVRRITPTEGSDVALAGNSTDVATGIEFDEDPSLDGNSNPRTVEVRLSGITPGPSESVDQTATVAVSASVDKPAIITDLAVDPASLSNSGTQTAIKFKIAKNAYGTGDSAPVITVTATDNSGASTVRKFRVNINPDNDTPVLADIANRTVSKSSGGANIPISVSDVETSRPFLALTAAADPSGAVANMVFDAARTTLSVVPSQSTLDAGTDVPVTITVTARDRGATDSGASGSGPAIQKSFTLTFSNKRPPTLTAGVTQQTFPEDGLATFNVTLTDDADLTGTTLTVSSSNEAVIPQGGILTSRNGGDITVVTVPNANANGSADITLRAIDADQLESSIVLKVTVTPVEDTPTLTLLKGVADEDITALEDANPVADSSSDSKLIEIEISDAETSADNLVVTAAATDAGRTLIPNSAITVSSTGAKRTIAIRPAANLNGDAEIVVTVRDQAGRTDTKSFDLHITAVNDQPTINNISNITVNEDASAQTINMEGIGTGAANESQTITVIASAKNKGANAGPSTIINDPVVSYTSANATGTLTFTPLPNASGTAVVDVTVTDNGGTANDGKNEKKISFEVTVNPVNDDPTIRVNNDVTEVTTSSGTATTVIPVVITDTEAPNSVDLAALQVTATSDNTTLVPNTTTALEIGGTGGSRGLIVRPVAGQFGTANITVTVTDAGHPAGSNVKTASKTFRLVVSAGQAPVISSISNVTLARDAFSDIIEFNISDAQTGSDSLQLSHTSSDTSVIPTGNVQFGGTGSARQMIIRAGTKPGVSTITLTVRDGDNNTTTRSFTVTVLGQDPTISAIANQVIAVGGTAGPLSFTVGDEETFPGFLTLEKASSNTSYVPLSGITFGGSGANRTVTVVPAANATGSSVITVTVKDGNGQSASRTFTVSTLDTNTAPTVSSISNRTTDVGTPTSLITFTVGDTETAAGSLTVAATSSNTTLVPNSSIALGGQGSANRTMLITPAAGQQGTATITVTVTDGGGKTAQTSFTLTVSASAVPTISSVSNQTIDKNTSANVTVTVGDAETAVGQLVITAASSNQALIPSSNVTVSGTGANRNVTITPANGQVGTATITLTVADSDNKTASTSFTVIVNQTGAAKGDINGDGKADLVFQDNDGFLAVWTADSDTVTGANYLTPSNVGDLSYRIAGSGDFNRDGKEDLLFQSTSGNLAVWYMDGGSQVDAAVLNPSSTGDTNWKVVGVGDFNRDGKADIALQHTNGTLGVWFMDGVNLSSAALIEPSNPGDAAWKIAGVGDLNGDGRQDLVFQHTDGTLACWNLTGANGVTVSTAALMNPSFAGDAAWRVVGVCDRNGDGKADLLFQHSDSSLAIWYMNGTTVTSAKMLNPSAPGGSWKVVAPR